MVQAQTLDWFDAEEAYIYYSIRRGIEQHLNQQVHCYPTFCFYAFKPVFYLIKSHEQGTSRLRIVYIRVHMPV